MSFSDWYFSFNPLMRGAIAAAGALGIMEVVKPNFAYAATEGGYVPRPMGSGKVTETDFEELVGGTNLPWFAVPALAFITFGLVI